MPIDDPESPGAAGSERLFRAFADRTRLRILHLLLHGELSVTDLAAVLRLPQPAISRHLAYLRRSGLVVWRKDGAWSRYALAPPRGALHARLLDCLPACFPGEPAPPGDDFVTRT